MSYPIPDILAERIASERVLLGGLTNRELQCVALLANGYREPEIAAKLHLSRWTVNTHLKRVRGRIGARTQAHAVALAMARGLIDVEYIFIP